MQSAAREQNAALLALLAHRSDGLTVREVMTEILASEDAVGIWEAANPPGLFGDSAELAAARDEVDSWVRDGFAFTSILDPAIQRGCEESSMRRRSCSTGVTLVLPRVVSRWSGRETRPRRRATERPVSLNCWSLAGSRSSRDWRVVSILPRTRLRSRPGDVRWV